MILTINLNMNDKFQKVGVDKLEEPDVTYKNFVQNLATYHFQVKAIIQASKLFFSLVEMTQST